MTKNEPPPDPEPGSMDELLRTKAHIEQGVENLVDIPAFEKAGMSPAELEAERKKDDLEAYGALATLGGGKPLPGDHELDSSGHFLPDRRSRLVALGIVLVMLAVAVAILGWRLTAGGGDTASGGGTAAVAPDSAPLAPAPTEAPEAAQTPGADETPAAPATPSATEVEAPDTWRFTGKYGFRVTITLIPSGEGRGTIAVKGEPDAAGKYTWRGSTLKIAYRQPVTLLNGNVEYTKGRFTCTGEPTSARLRCTIRALAWASTSTSQSSQWLSLTATGRPLP
jgi:hypothetical protein